MDRHTLDSLPVMPSLQVAHQGRWERCPSCSQWFDARDLADVLHHDFEKPTPKRAH